MRLSSTTTRTLPPSRRNARSCSSAQTWAARPVDQQPHGLARVAQRQHEEPRTPVLAGSGITDHRSVAVVDLRFLPWGRRDHYPGIGGGTLEELGDESPHTGIPGRKAVRIDQVLPDGHGVAPPADGLDDQLAIGFAGARPRRSTGAVIGHGGGLTRARGGREYCRRVGGHLRGNGRFCRTNGRPAAAAHRHAGRLQVAAGRLAPDPGCPFDLPQRPAEASQRQDLLSFVFCQDVAHAGQELAVPDRCQRLGPLSVMAGFQVSTNGRFWVSTEGRPYTGYPAPTSGSPRGGRGVSIWPRGAILEERLSRLSRKGLRICPEAAASR